MRFSLKPKTLVRELQQFPRRLAVGLGIALALLLGLGVASYRNLERQAAASDWVAHTYQVVAGLQQVFAGVQDAESAQRGFGQSGNETYLVPYYQSVHDLPNRLDALGKLISDNPSRTAQLTKLRADIARRLDLVKVRIEQRRQLGLAALDPKYLTGAGVQLMNNVRADVDTMSEAETRLLHERLRVLARVRARSVVLQMLGGVCSIILLSAVFVGLAKQMLRTKRAEQEAQRSNIQLRDVNNELRAFSYSVAHDLRTPLRAMGGFAQIIVEDYGDKLDTEGQRVLGRIIGNAKMMGQLIDDLLSLSKITYQPLRTSKVDMEALVRGVCSELFETDGERKVECEIVDLPPASGDSSLLRQVWLNLIANALKFTRQRERAHIEIGGNVAGPEFVTYFIRDNGAGFDMQYADKLFGAFQRLHRATDFEGTGIGLALVQRIVHRHGGTVWAEGKENEGARFAFTLPEWVDG